MAVAVRAQFPSGTTTLDNNSGTTATTSITTVAGDLVICHITVDATATVSGSTCNSAAFDSTSGSISSNNQGAGFSQAFAWKAPATGTFNVVTTVSGSAFGQKVYCISGTDNASVAWTTFAPSGTGTNTSCSITSPTIPTSGIGLGMFSGGSAFSATGQTTLNRAGITSPAGAAGFLAECSQAGAGSERATSLVGATAHTVRSWWPGGASDGSKFVGTGQ